METMRLKMMKLKILDCVQLRHEKAISYGVQVQKEIGYKFVWKRGLVPLQALSLALNTIKGLKKLPVVHFESVGLMKDQNIVQSWI